MTIAETYKIYTDALDTLCNAVFCVTRLSDRYLTMTYFDKAMQSLEIKVLDFNSAPVDIISRLTADELIAFGTMQKALNQWLDDDMRDPFPIEMDEDAYAIHRANIG